MNDFINNKIFFNSWQITLVIVVFWTAIQLPLSFVDPLFNKKITAFIEIFQSVFLTLNLFLKYKYNYSIQKVKHQYENKIIVRNKFKHNFWIFLEILSLIPFVPFLNLIRFIYLKDFLSTKYYLKNTYQLLFVFLGIITTINTFASVWMILSPRNDLSFGDEYIMALYWAVTTLTTVGYGDITPQNNPARIFTMFTMMTGVSSFALIIGNLSRLLLLKDRHQEERKNKINSLQDLMSFYHVPEDTRKQILHFYHHLLEKKVVNEDVLILKELPMSLQQEINLYMKIKLLHGIDIFKHSQNECLKMVALNLEEEFYSPEQVIVKTGDEGNEMYLINHGEIDIIKNGELLVSLKAGSLFGEMALIDNEKRSADIISRTYSDIFILRKENFKKICEKYPQLESAFMKIYESRKKENLEQLTCSR